MQPNPLKTSLYVSSKSVWWWFFIASIRTLNETYFCTALLGQQRQIQQDNICFCAGISQQSYHMHLSIGLKRKLTQYVKAGMVLYTLGHTVEITLHWAPISILKVTLQSFVKMVTFKSGVLELLEQIMPMKRSSDVSQPSYSMK